MPAGFKPPVTKENSAPLFGFDPGGRTRVSQITTLGDYKMVGVDKPLLFSDAGTGTGAWANNKFTMSVAGSQYYIRESKRRHPYFSGKGQLAEITFDSFGHEAGITKRVGYFSSSTVAPYTASLDGFWLESDGTEYYIRAYRNGTQVISVPTQGWDNWSEVQEYNFEMFSVIAFDFLWLGGAVLRFWLKTKEGFVLVHSEHYSGTQEDTFILSPMQPLRVEIRAANAGGQMRFICGQVATEGSIEESGVSGAVNTGATGINFAAVGTVYPLIAVRKKTTRLDAVVRLIDLAIDVASAADRLLWTLQINPTLSAGLTYADVTNYAIQVASGDGTITVTAPGTILASGFLSTGGIVPPDTLKTNFLAWLGQTIGGVMDQYVLCVTPITVNVAAHGALTVKEY